MSSIIYLCGRFELEMIGDLIDDVLLGRSLDCRDYLFRSIFFPEHLCIQNEYLNITSRYLNVQL